MIWRIGWGCRRYDVDLNIFKVLKSEGDPVYGTIYVYIGLDEHETLL